MAPTEVMPGIERICPLEGKLLAPILHSQEYIVKLTHADEQKRMIGLEDTSVPTTWMSV